MELLQNIVLLETQKAADKEVEHVIGIINKIHNEWKATGRRKNAVDLITTSVNKLSNINPAILPHIYDATKIKLVVALMRCMDIPMWKPVESKEKIYRKLYPLISKLQNYHPNVETNGTLREVILTRLSACIYDKQKDKSVFVAYEPKLPTKYLNYVFGSGVPKKTYRMASLPLPEDFDSLIEILEINQKKALAKIKLL